MTAYRAKPPKGALLNRADPLAKGLVAAWLFNEGNGPRAEDSVRKNHATLNNFSFTSSSGWAGGPYGKCPVFDGTNDRITAPAVITSATHSVAASFLFNNLSNYYSIFSAYTSNTDAVEIFHAFATGNNAGSLFGGNFTNGAYSAAGSIVANTWYRVVLTSTGTVTQLYLNGKASGTPGTTGMSTFTATTVIGARATSFFIPGRVDNVLVWNNRCLTAAEVRRDFADPFRMFRRRSVPVPLKASPQFKDGGPVIPIRQLFNRSLTRR